MFQIHTLTEEKRNLQQEIETLSSKLEEKSKAGHYFFCFSILISTDKSRLIFTSLSEKKTVEPSVHSAEGGGGESMYSLTTMFIYFICGRAIAGV